MPMAGLQILSLVIFFKRGCLPSKGDIKNHYCHILRFKTRSDVYYGGKQVHSMLKSHSNFLGIGDMTMIKLLDFSHVEKAQHFINCYRLSARPVPATAFWFLNTVLLCLFQVCRLLTGAQKSGNNM